MAPRPRILPSEPLDPAQPLAAASARLHKGPPKPPPPVPPSPPKKRGRPPKPVDLTKLPARRGRRPFITTPDLVIGMKAAGVPQSRIAAALNTSANVITTTLNREPDSRERIAALREKLKDLKMEKAHRVEGKMWARLETEVDSGDAKSVDAMARALLASEKIQAAASGEAHASGPAPPPSAGVDLAGLIQVLINAS